MRPASWTGSQANDTEAPPAGLDPPPSEPWPSPPEPHPVSVDSVIITRPILSALRTFHLPRNLFLFGWRQRNSVVKTIQVSNQKAFLRLIGVRSLRGGDSEPVGRNYLRRFSNWCAKTLNRHRYSYFNKSAVFSAYICNLLKEHEGYSLHLDFIRQN